MESGTNQDPHAANDQAIMTAEIGSRTTPVGGHPVPDECTEGFGTWSPVKPECAICPYVAPCFCRSTDTHPRVIRLQKKPTVSASTKRSKPMQTETSKSTIKNDKLNPYRKGSHEYEARVVFLSMVESGKSAFTDADLHTRAKELGFDKTKENEPSYWSRRLYVFDPKYNTKETDRPKGDPFFGLVEVIKTGDDQPRSYKVDVVKCQQIVAELSVTPEASSGSKSESVDLSDETADRSSDTDSDNESDDDDDEDEDES